MGESTLASPEAGWLRLHCKSERNLLPPVGRFGFGFGYRDVADQFQRVVIVERVKTFAVVVMV